MQMLRRTPAQDRGDIRGFPSWLFYATVLVVGVAIFVVVNGLHSSAMQSREAQARINDLKEDVAEELVERYRARAVGEVAPEVPREIAEERQQMDEELAQLERRDPGDDEALARVREGLADARPAIDRELSLISSDRMGSSAEQVERVDEAYEAVDDALETVSEGYDARAQRASSIANVGILLAVFAGASSILAMFSYYERRRRTMERRLQYRALHDPLTDLPNRPLLLDRMRQALRRAERSGAMTAVLFLDLDNFKAVNDSLGHRAGDQLLVELSERLPRCLRSGDTVARIGGDEFAFLLEDVRDVDEAVGVAARVSREAQSPMMLEGQEVALTASIGVAASPSGADRPEDLLRNADLAMYEAKKRGKNRYRLFDASTGSATRTRLRLASELRRAVERQEFSVRYQPKVMLGDPQDTRPPRIVGVEALVRWEHPTRGLISPVDFIPIAEETGLILPIGSWVLEEACRKAVELQRACPTNPPLMMSVNLSARQFETEDLASDVARVLAQSGLDPSSLLLEITESVLMADAPVTTTVLQELKALGVGIAVDDFGTGYSSLSYLNRFPVDFLKIDRSFASHLEQNVESVAVVSSMIELSRVLGLKTVAEGVETPEQLRLLEELGCDLAQGFHFAPPLTGDEVLEVIQTSFTTDPRPARSSSGS
jgi:diguanylate cyclase (GGDEF)-like protein